MTGRRSPTLTRVAVVVGVLIVATLCALAIISRTSSSPGDGLARNPYLDPGTPVSGTAPDFTLTDQFGRQVSLHSFLGRVVIVAFNDSKCTTICPLTTTAMVDAKQMLGAAGSKVQLLGIDANPDATSIKDVRSYSQAHGMLTDWHFLTSSLPRLKRVWEAYHIAVQIEAGQIDHTPALYVIDTKGRLARLYLTQQSYSAVGQLGQLLAHEASSLLPGHPPVRSDLSYNQIPTISPATAVSVPREGGGAVALGPGRSSRLLVFFDTWDSEVTDLRRQLEELGAYQSAAVGGRLPELTAVDERSVEPSSSALPHFLSTLRNRLSYPVAIDQSGRIADGYGVQDEPWLVLVSSAGRILWWYDVSTSGWLSHAALIKRVRAALARPPSTPSSAAAVRQELVGSPAPLAGLHDQASKLLGSESALAARVRALRGYPIVINAWASWCTPCRSEFSLFASASARYGRVVAFIGADTDDSAGDAQSFLAQHPVSYPSYQSSTPQLQSLVPQGLDGLPTTIYINRAGKLVYVHTGQYVVQGTLDQDIATYALAPG
jgi:cytochrome oxidase Cu insertion factor (SCO1/SenC/PrrC family)/thiol-disulfide isomerase/thioredoxin